MPMYDFECQDHGIFEDFSFVNKATGMAEPVSCWCGRLCARVWIQAPGLASDENPSRELIAAAKAGMVYGDRKVEPFQGETRSELNRWMKDNQISAFTQDERARGNSTVNTKKRFTETKEFEDALAKAVIETDELRQAGKLDDHLKQIEKPDDYDKGVLAQQLGAEDPLVKGLMDNEKVPYDET
jgi:hypothetical protein